MKTPPKRNYLILGASFLIVGLVVEFTTAKLIRSELSAVYKTFMVMLLIMLGYSFAEAVIARAARESLKLLQQPFIKIAGSSAGKAIFYVLIFGVLFALYMLVFVYAMDPSNFYQVPIPIA